MIDRFFCNMRSPLYLTIVVGLLCVLGCVPHYKEIKTQHLKQSDTLSSFILDERLRDSLQFVLRDPSVIYNPVRKITIYLDNTKDGVDVSFFILNSFAYTIERSVFLGAPNDGNDPIIVFCKGDIPSIIDVSMLDYKKGLEYLGTDSLDHIWDDVRPFGSWKTYRLIDGAEPQLIDSGYVGR